MTPADAMMVRLDESAHPSGIDAERRQKNGMLCSRQMRAAVEISMYPLIEGYRTMIRAFIERLKSDPELVVRSNTLSTQLWGDMDHLMQVLSREMRLSADAGAQLVFVLKVLPGVAAPGVAAPGVAAPGVAAPGVPAP